MSLQNIRYNYNLNELTENKSLFHVKLVIAAKMLYKLGKLLIY